MAKKKLFPAANQAFPPEEEDDVDDEEELPVHEEILTGLEEEELSSPPSHPIVRTSGQPENGRIKRQKLPFRNDGGARQRSHRRAQGSMKINMKARGRNRIPTGKQGRRHVRRSNDPRKRTGRL